MPTVFLFDPPGLPGGAAWMDRLAARLHGRAVAVETADSPEALAERAQARPQAPVIVLGPRVGEPLAVARWLTRRLNAPRFVFAVDPAGEAAFRRQAAYAAPAGTHWIAVPADADELDAQIGHETERAAQGAHLRLSLQRLKLQGAPPHVPDLPEYQRLVASDRYLASVLRHAHDAIVSVDVNGRVVSWNRGAEQLFDRASERVLRQPLPGLFADPAGVEAALEAALSGTPRATGLKVERAGAVRYVDANFAPMHDERDRVIGAVVILRDTTERQQAEEELRRSSRQKDEFLAMLAHELRNPLAPIRNATEILSMLHQDDPRGQKATQIIARQTEHMAGLIEDLLDVARVTRGAFVLKRDVVSLSDVVADAVEQALALVESRGHRLEISADDCAPHVLGDRKRLTQVFANLLNNAAKYTPEGGEIRISVSTQATQAVVSVSDSGVGMTPDLQARVFDLFVQAERTPDRAAGGLGIGLALVRSLVSMHGGTVSAHSDGLGRGSRFEVRLPLTASPAAASRPPPAERAETAASLAITVVDDSEDSAHSLGILLQAHGYRAEVETDPRAALQRAQQARADVYVLDIGMPHLDGYELARRLRSLPAGTCPVLIALTGYGQDSDRERARAAGFDHHLVKPLDPETLLGLLQGLSAEKTAKGA